jgi:uncharacterized YkwD family protein
MNRRGLMKSRRVSAVLFLVVLLVLSMASTAFAGTVSTANKCGASIEKEAEKEAGSKSGATGENKVVVSLGFDPIAVIMNEPKAPAAEQPQQPVEEPQQPVEGPQQPVEEPQQPVEEPQQPVQQPPSANEGQQAPSGGADQDLTGLNAQEREMVEYVNQERAKAGLSPLQVDLDLARVARTKSQDMVDNGYFDHNSPTYGSPFEMMRSFGISYRAAGENIAKNSSVMGAHTALMNSEGHRANILNPNFTHIGIGIVSSGNMVTVTQMFISK